MILERPLRATAAAGVTPIAGGIDGGEVAVTPGGADPPVEDSSLPPSTIGFHGFWGVVAAEAGVPFCGVSDDVMVPTLGAQTANERYGERHRYYGQDHH